MIWSRRNVAITYVPTNYNVAETAKTDANISAGRLSEIALCPHTFETYVCHVASTQLEY